MGSIAQAHLVYGAKISDKGLVKKLWDLYNEGLIVCNKEISILWPDGCENIFQKNHWVIFTIKESEMLGDQFNSTYIDIDGLFVSEHHRLSQGNENWNVSLKEFLYINNVNYIDFAKFGWYLTATCPE